MWHPLGSVAPDPWQRIRDVCRADREVAVTLIAFARPAPVFSLVAELSFEGGTAGVARWCGGADMATWPAVVPS